MASVCSSQFFRFSFSLIDLGFLFGFGFLCSLGFDVSFSFVS